MFTHNYDPVFNPLLEKLKLSKAPMVLEARPDKQAEAHDPLQTVQNKVESRGGKALFGWKFSNKHGLLEAVSHVVYVSPNSLINEISEEDTAAINFCPAPEFSHSGSNILPSIRIPLSENPLLADYIKVSEAWDKLKFNTGEEENKLALEWLHHVAKSILSLSLTTESTQAPCSCGSKLPYNECLGASLDSFITAVSTHADMAEWSLNTSCAELSI